MSDAIVLGGGAKAAAAIAPRVTGDSLALVRLLQLASPALPIGGYSYSQGLESAVDDALVHDAASAEVWIGDLLDLVVAHGDAPVLWRLLAAVAGSDRAAFDEWNTWFHCSRETSELRAETVQMGAALAKLALDIDLLDGRGRDALNSCAQVTLPAAFALVADGFRVAADDALTAYIWSWLENQTMAALKAVPLGQVAGQRLLLRLGTRIPRVVAAAAQLSDDDISTFAPGLALASSRHETLYTRLFRS